MTATRLRARALSLARPASRVRVGPNAGAALLALALLTPLAATNGGYFPTSWGWVALVPLWVSVLVLSLAGEVRLSRLELAFLAALAALAGWILLSTLWTSSPTATALEAERALVYPAGALAALLVARRASASALLGGAWAAITIVCAYALATRLFPDRLGVFDAIAGYRLSAPVGYWNALGLFAAMGTLLALGLDLSGVAARSQVIFTFERAACALDLFLDGFRVLPRRANPVDDLAADASRLAAAVWQRAKRSQAGVPKRALPHHEIYRRHVARLRDPSLDDPFSLQAIGPTLRSLFRLCELVYPPGEGTACAPTGVPRIPAAVASGGERSG